MASSTTPEQDDKNSLKHAENSFYSGSGAKSADKSIGGAGLKAASKSNPLAKTVVKNLSKHKKGIGIGGGAVISAVVIFSVFFGLLVSHEIQIIEEDIDHYMGAAVTKVVDDASRHIRNAIFCRQITALASSSKCKEDKNEDNQDDNPEQEPEPLAEDINTANIAEDPNIETTLEDGGVTPNINSAGKIDGFTDEATGKPMDLSELDSPSSDGLFNEAVPVEKVGVLETQEPLLETDVGANFDGLGPSDSSNVDQDVVDDILDPESTSSNPLINPEQDNPSIKAEASKEEAKNDPNAVADAEANTSDVNAALDSTEAAIKNGKQVIPEVDATAITAAEVAENAAAFLKINLIVQDFCTIRNVAASGALNRIPEIIGLLTRHYTTLSSVADEEKVGGKLSSHQITGFNSIFNGDPQYSESSKNPIQRQAALPFDRSAAWMRVTGQSNAIDTNSNTANEASYTPDISKSSLPQQTSATNIIGVLDSAFDYSTIGVGPPLCKVDTGILGTIATYAIGGIQIGIAIFSGGISVGASDALIAAAQTSLRFFLIPLIEHYFTPVLLYGLENSVQWTNNATAGSNIAYNMYSQRLGGQPLTTKRAVTLNAAAMSLQQEQQKQLPLTNRLFALSNPRSLLSRVAIALPMSRVDMFYSLGRTLFKSPVLLINDIGDLLSGPKAFALSPSDPGQPYGLTQYGFTVNQLNMYNPLENESYLYHTDISYGGSKPMSLISLLGNPSQYPNAENDPNTNQVLNCFTRPYTAAILNETSPSPICGTEGSLDYVDRQPVPIGVPQVAYSFCEQIIGSASQGCINYMEADPALSNIMIRFRTYILDMQVAGYYMDLQTQS